MKASVLALACLVGCSSPAVVQEKSTPPFDPLSVWVETTAYSLCGRAVEVVPARVNGQQMIDMGGYTVWIKVRDLEAARHICQETSLPEIATRYLGDPGRHRP